MNFVIMVTIDAPDQRAADLARQEVAGGLEDARDAGYLREGTAFAVSPAVAQDAPAAGPEHRAGA